MDVKNTKYRICSRKLRPRINAAPESILLINTALEYLSHPVCGVYSNTKQKKIIKLHYNNVMEHILSGVQPKSVVFLKTQNWNDINVELKYKVYVVFTFQSVAYLKCLR